MGSEVSTVDYQDKMLDAFDERSSDVGSDEAAYFSGAQGGGKYMSMNGKTGVVKMDGQEVTLPISLPMDLFNAERGWEAWINKKKLHSSLAHWLSPNRAPGPEAFPELPPKAFAWDGWSEVCIVKVCDMDTGNELSWTLKDDQPWRPIRKLLKAYKDQVKLHRDTKNGSGYMIPVVEIDAESYNSKYGTNYSPTFKIVDWVSNHDLMEIKRAGAANAAIAAGDAEEPETVAAVHEKVALPPPETAAKASFSGNRVGRRT